MRKNELLERIREAGYPHVAYKIELHWNEPTIKDVFNELLYNHREGRQGFPKEVFSCLLDLYSRVKMEGRPKSDNA